ncbi:MAG: adenylate/guanylate cyclase domain-containing protein [Actinomycetota bacterium]|nr:adenylate/guanylate cyclase domain-containing protein [Actinomycetota bacterium]
MENPDVHYARNGETTLAYQVVGNGPIDMVFVPQWIGNLELAWENPLFARFLRRLASFSRLVLMDRRGVGLSDRLSPIDVPPLEILVEDLGVVMDAAGVERASLFGGSDSGCLCAMFAATYPQRTSALVLYSCEARAARAPDYPFGFTDEEWEEYLSALAAGWGTADYVAQGLQWFAPSIAHDADQQRWWLRMQRLSASPNSVVASERIWRALDIRAILPSIQAPTLVLHRSDDDVDRVEAGRYLAQRIPGAKFVELPGKDWLAWAGDQTALLDEVESFVRGIGEEEARLDRVLATVLFTDIVDSTAQSAAVGDREWRKLREDHDRIVRSQLARYRGREVKTMGDGFLATFDGPARGVTCAGAIVDAVRPLGLQVRAGLHTGEIELDGGDVAGIAVSIGARVGAKAGPSEVLVSQTVKDLVAGSGLIFEDAGEHELKGVPDRWHLYRVAGG